MQDLEKGYPILIPTKIRSLSTVVMGFRIHQVQISENAVIKVDEIQSPIVGGCWKAKTEFGVLEIKIEPYWTGEQRCFVTDRLEVA